MAYFRCGGQGASGDAVAADVLLNKTFSNDDDTDVVGTMPNNGKVTPSGLNCGGSYTIPAGYHNGQGVVTANSLASQTGVDSGKTAVGAAQMLTGYQGWVNGSKITGTMANKGAWTPSNINPGGSVTIPAGYHNGSGKVTANANQNSGTKTITSSDANWLTGNVDMGANNTYRYVNAVNVYNKGKADGAGGKSGTLSNCTANTEYTINTGLSSIRFIYFVITAAAGTYSTKQDFYVFYPESGQSANASKVMTGTADSNSSSSSFYFRNLNDPPSDAYAIITSVSGGTVKFKTAKIGGAAGGSWKWFAV